jgi:hypothetical protein
LSTTNHVAGVLSDRSRLTVSESSRSDDRFAQGHPCRSFEAALRSAGYDEWAEDKVARQIAEPLAAGVVSAMHPQEKKLDVLRRSS